MAPARPVPDLTCDDSFRRAAGKIIWTRFEEMLAYRDAALAGVNDEGVHDMRVASRRLRAALELFSAAFARDRLRPFLREVKEIADTLGTVRDLDVQLDRLRADAAGRPEAQTVVLDGLIADLEGERKKARKRLRQVLDDLQGSNFSREFLSFVAQETL